MVVSMVEMEEVRRLTRKEYDLMVERGILDEDEKIELLRGQIVPMSAIGSRHTKLVIWLNARLIRSLDPSYEVRPGCPFAADDYSEPEPDLAVRGADVRQDHPDTLLLVIEVSDSSLRKDRGIKQAIYAAAGVPEYWIFDVQHDVVEVYTRPRGETYEQLQTLRAGDILRPTQIPGLAITLDELPR
jgi:Uma2 family endonuclease